MGYGYTTYPFWRIYCEDHAELLVKQKIRKLQDAMYNKLLKFCRAVNRHADLYGDKPADNSYVNSSFKRLYTKTKSARPKVKKTAPGDEDRQRKIVEAFLSSFYENNNVNSSQQFIITLRRDPNDDYEVTEIAIPPPDDDLTQEDEGQLGKRKSKELSPPPKRSSKKKAKAEQA